MFTLLSVSAAIPAHGQKVTAGEDGMLYVEPLFEYAVAPEYLQDITAKSDYLMDNFWNDMNFKAKTVNQSALVHAFQVYTSPMRWASKAKVYNSVAALIKKLQKNPSLLLQFTKAAEETIYGPRAEYYIDDVYEMFLESVNNHKKIKPNRKERYQRQLKAIRTTQLGEIAPQLELTGTDGSPIDLKPGKHYTLYLFGNGRQSDLRQWLLKLENNVAVERLSEKGDLGIVYCSLGEKNEEEDAQISSVEAPMQAGYVKDRGEAFDIRFTPSVYLLDSDGKIVIKNSDLGIALMAIRPPRATQPDATGISPAE